MACQKPFSRFIFCSSNTKKFSLSIQLNVLFHIICLANDKNEWIIKKVCVQYSVCICCTCVTSNNKKYTFSDTSTKQNKKSFSTIGEVMILQNRFFLTPKLSKSKKWPYRRYQNLFFSAKDMLTTEPFSEKTQQNERNLTYKMWRVKNFVCTTLYKYTHRR